MTGKRKAGGNSRVGRQGFVWHDSSIQSELFSARTSNIKLMKLRSFPSRRQGFTLVEIMIVVGVIGIMLMIAIPNFISARARAQVRICVKNLKSIDEAKQQWGFENRKLASAVPTWANIEPYFKNVQRRGVCPSGGNYNLRRLDLDPRCSKRSVGHDLGNTNLDNDPGPN